MAGVCEEAKIVFNVALAGTLEERGFERVSDAHYARKETIGEAEVIWRVLLGPQLASLPKSFRDSTGYYIPEVDRLCKRAYPNQDCASWAMAGTRYKSHYALPISERFREVNKVRFKRWPKLSQSESCFQDREGFNGRPSHWNVESGDLEALGYRLERYWCNYIEPWYQEVDARIRRGPSIQSDYKFGDPYTGVSTIMKYWALGHHDAVISILKKVVESEIPSHKQLEAVARYRTWQRSMYPIFWRFQRVSEDAIIVLRNEAKRDAQQAKYIASVLGIEKEVHFEGGSFRG